jgi:tetratricopeptide (TPR) repeat protein
MRLANFLPRAWKTAVAATLSALCVVASSAGASEVQDAYALLQAGQQAQALARVDKILVSDPTSPEARFLKGVILAEQGKTKAATDVFEGLTRDYPALPEPYNNLAVIYAAQGQYGEARLALEKSIRTHPSYATAYENLGDVYAKLASDAYDRALRLDSTNNGARKKLALVRELTGQPPTRLTQLAAAASTPNRPPAASKPPPPSAATVTQAPASVRPPAPPKPTPKAPTAVATARPTPPAPAPAPAPSTRPLPDAAALATVVAWAKAWSAKDVERYLGFYAPAFKTPRGEPRAAWEEKRSARIHGPRSIDVSISSAKVLRHDDDHVAVTFRQAYRSERFQGSTRKTLELVRDGEDWRIVGEHLVTR